MGCTVTKKGSHGATRLPGGLRNASIHVMVDKFQDINKDGINNGINADLNDSKSVKATDELDKRLPLTERQMYSVRKSWKAIGRNMAKTGVTMFVRSVNI